MSVGALVTQVGDLLGRGHALFGAPPASGGAAAKESGAALATAGDLVRSGQLQMSSQRGMLAADYAGFATHAGPALEAAGAVEDGLGEHLHDAAGTDRSGRRSSRAVLTGAATDTAAMAPSSGSAAGQRAIVSALRARVAQQERVIAAYKTRDARLAAELRSLVYSRRTGGKRMPMGTTPFGLSPGGGPGMSGGGFAGMSGPPTSVSGMFNPSTSASATSVAPGRPVGMPLGELTVNSGPREVASAIIHEAQRRGYSPEQTTAILADALQESNLNPRACSPNRLWESIFQQDASYPGRRNPNLAISEFFNRLDRHGGPSSPNIWHSIFWLQQRPGDPSADQALANGRRAYLAEIFGRRSQAMAMYRDITGA